MNPHQEYSGSLISMVSTLIANRQLIWQMAVRDVVGRYKGSIIGLGWSFVIPLLMLVVYTFVFSVVFEARWGTGSEESKLDFAIVLFVGIIVHSIFSEAVNRAPTLILNNVNYVKKVVFPLEILVVIALSSALFHGVVSLFVLLGAIIVLHQYLPWTVILVPVIIAPLVFVTLGVSWFLASLGVYLRDIGQTINVVTMVMLFLAPVFYPMSVLPEQYQMVMLVNPLTFIIEQVRQVLIFGQLPNWKGLAVYTMISITILWVGYWWFQRTRRGFADVI